MNESIIISRAKYVCSAVGKDQYPERELPEIVFMGRSNVGKSSLINSLSRMNRLAHTSSQPGKTRTINFYELCMKRGEAEERLSFYLVDLPGYGYAKAGKDQRRVWERFIEEYMLTSKNLCFVCQLVDIRHPPMESDMEKSRWLIRNGLPVLTVATKADKIGKNARKKQLSAIRKGLELPEDSLMAYSSESHEGRDELLETMWQAVRIRRKISQSDGDSS